jgi:hypothetical protein
MTLVISLSVIALLLTAIVRNAKICVFELLALLVSVLQAVWFLSHS